MKQGQQRVHREGDGAQKEYAAREAINGWVKAALFAAFHMDESKPMEEIVTPYIRFSNDERPAVL